MPSSPLPTNLPKPGRTCLTRTIPHLPHQTLTMALMPRLSTLPKKSVTSSVRALFVGPSHHEVGGIRIVGGSLEVLFEGSHDCQDDVIVPVTGDDLHTNGQAGAVFFHSGVWVAQSAGSRAS